VNRFQRIRTALSEYGGLIQRNPLEMHECPRVYVYTMTNRVDDYKLHNNVDKCDSNDLICAEKLIKYHVEQLTAKRDFLVLHANHMACRVYATSMTYVCPSVPQFVTLD